MATWHERADERHCSRFEKWGRLLSCVGRLLLYIHGETAPPQKYFPGAASRAASFPHFAPFQKLWNNVRDVKSTIWTILRGQLCAIVHICNRLIFSFLFIDKAFYHHCACFSTPVRLSHTLGHGWGQGDTPWGSCNHKTSSAWAEPSDTAPRKHFGTLLPVRRPGARR